ncbi:MAG: type II toxin-antitoxin system VapC family toxin [Acidimicrobiaceae bacterium]|nr:type II toxin-antitoxin system VapC family toxin [Acidimicrobiaceae bacterium]
MSFVLDNSVVMRWFFGDGSQKDLEYSLAVLEQVPLSRVMVPAVWSLEVTNVIVRAETKGLVSEARSAEFVRLLADMDIKEETIESSLVFGNVLSIARRYSISTYDASYLELAMRNGVELATLDVDLIRAANQAGVSQFLSQQM